MQKLSKSSLLSDIAKLIESAKQHVSREFNVTHVLLNWHIGIRINKEILKNDRADYGKNVISELSKSLREKYGSGYDKTALTRMIKFSKLYHNKEIVAALSQRLGWSHIIQLIAIKDDLKRNFYAEMCRIESWDVRTLREKTNSLLFERTSLSKKPDKVIQKEIAALKDTNTLTPDFIFHDPCFLTFTGLERDYSETDLENAILDELTQFLQEFGSDFCFIARQKRMSTGSIDRFLDLLFFHRGLKRLIAVELKIGRFEPAHKGQMEWYLNWLNKNEKRAGERKPLGIILCADKDQEDIEYLELNRSGIHVAQYLTQLPSKKILEDKLRKAITKAREKHARLQVISKRSARGL